MRDSNLVDSLYSGYLWISRLEGGIHFSGGEVLLMSIYRPVTLIQRCPHFRVLE